MLVKVKKNKLLLELNIQLKVRLRKKFYVLAHINEQSPEGVLPPVVGSV